MKFLVPNYSCLQNPWLGGYRPQIPVLSVLNWICWTPPEKNSWVRHCLPRICFLLLELYVCAVLAHTFWTMAEFTKCFAVLLCHTNRTHSMPSTFGFLHNCSAADCFQATPTPPISTQFVCKNFRYQPFLWTIVSPFLYDILQVQMSLTIYINYINKS